MYHIIVYHVKTFGKKMRHIRKAKTFRSGKSAFVILKVKNGDACMGDLKGRPNDVEGEMEQDRQPGTRKCRVAEKSNSFITFFEYSKYSTLRLVSETFEKAVSVLLNKAYCGGHICFVDSRTLTRSLIGQINVAVLSEYRIRNMGY